MSGRGGLCETLLPVFDVESRHRSQVRGDPRRVYDVARRLDLSQSLLVRALFALRGMPGSSLTAEGLERIRFKPLVEDPPHGFALGIVGRFWTLSGGLVDFEPSDFTALEMPGRAKALWTFEMTPGADGVTHVETATRIRCMGDDARRRFLRYWRLIGPFSGLIRREALRVVKRQVEKG